jgi:hypothetical protein
MVFFLTKHLSLCTNWGPIKPRWMDRWIAMEKPDYLTYSKGTVKKLACMGAGRRAKISLRAPLV